MLKNEWNYNLELEVQREEGIKEVAKKMLTKNKFSAEEIAEYTGLNIADVVLLQSKMANS